MKLWLLLPWLLLLKRAATDIVPFWEALVFLATQDTFPIFLIYESYVNGKIS